MPDMKTGQRSRDEGIRTLAGSILSRLSLPLDYIPIAAYLNINVTIA